ncbi:methylated-DNA--[protein]-cysteine S-methyltransferase [Pontibacter sp. G13]|uniref:methylated-DNA--[protein]-cysteine S-methyltransferase n=1 Tax=Pontibacter sp. G13 TaxID=3074898 RepID=UPI00288A3B22|nr:methylated-DNA--[protein]-cysteine S-methyltransferase [Pontibacter sp. G13]WNJ19680.1 methylated-DNA--[protein]-cysteine S-methyltransferase [Pontibacter sp. G13]
MSIIAKTYCDTPLGTVEIAATEQGISHLKWVEFPTYEIDPGNSLLIQCIDQLTEYFEGNRTHFTVFLDLQGTDFQRKVWREIMEIPLGKTATYLEIARKVSSKDAVRAVGTACGANKHLMLVPCHRVVGTNGNLTGYAGGVSRKRKLLDHEWGVLFGKQGELF